MGKETQLLEAAAAGNRKTVEQILKGHSRLKRLLSKEKVLDQVDEDSDQTDGPTQPPLLIQSKLTSSHIDVNCTDDSGSSPLILAALNGHKDIVYSLLQYSANLHDTDKQGNTALHFAAWQNRSEIVELLLVNGAIADQTNNAGNTPLHYACQYCPTGKTFTIIKLLQHNSGALIRNKAGDTPFDLAVRFNRREAVSLLVDAEPDTLRQTKSIIEASKNGRRDVVEILLEEGMDPNCFDGTSGSCPLHEACRFFRKDVAKVLLEFGAECHQKSANDESPMEIILQHPDAQREQFMQLFREYHGKSARIPRSILERTKSSEKQDNEVFSEFITHPLLRNKPHWTRADPEFCSAWTRSHPPSCLLDNDPTTYWKIPAAGAYSWVNFDLGGEYTLSGIRISGWGNKQMVHTIIIETAKSLSGPWTKEGKYTADMVGPEDMEEAAESQDFRGFYASSRYWRLTVADNFGDPSACMAEVQFFGVENGVVEWFEKLGVKQHKKSMILRGYNQLSDLALLTERDLHDVVSRPEKRREMLHAAGILREQFYPPSNLQWAIPPPVKIIAEKQLPEISVFSESFTVGDLEIVVNGKGNFQGRTVVPLAAKDNGYLSKASFRGLSLSPAGTYLIEVRSVSDPSVKVTASDRILVVPPPMRQSEIGQVFSDLEKMLQFDF